MWSAHGASCAAAWEPCRQQLFPKGQAELEKRQVPDRSYLSLTPASLLHVNECRYHAGGKGRIGQVTGIPPSQPC